MSHDEIQKNLTEADRLVSEGRISDAHAIVIECSRHGMTPSDLHDNLSRDSIVQLRTYAATTKR